jgi:hypothetical protein
MHGSTHDSAVGPQPVLTYVDCHSGRSATARGTPSTHRGTHRGYSEHSLHRAQAARQLRAVGVARASGGGPRAARIGVPEGRSIVPFPTTAEQWRRGWKYWGNCEYFRRPGMAPGLQPQRRATSPATCCTTWDGATWHTLYTCRLGGARQHLGGPEGREHQRRVLPQGRFTVVLPAAVLTPSRRGAICRSAHRRRCRLPAITALRCIALHCGRACVLACERRRRTPSLPSHWLLHRFSCCGWLAGRQGGREEAAPEDGLRMPAAERLRLHARCAPAELAVSAPSA